MDHLLGGALTPVKNEEGKTAWYVRHAEQACLDRMLHSTETTEGAIMIITHSPCRLCSLGIKEAGIQEALGVNTETILCRIPS